MCFFFLMIRRPPRSTLDRSSAASDVYKRQVLAGVGGGLGVVVEELLLEAFELGGAQEGVGELALSLIHISEPTRPY